MKAREENGTIKIYPEIPKDWNNILNFRNASDETHRSEGFFDLVTPEYNSETQKLGDIFFDTPNFVFTFNVFDKTQEEILEEKERLLNELDSRLDAKSIRLLLAILAKPILESVSVSQDELDMLSAVYQQYRVGKYYTAGEVFVYEGNLYKVNEGQAHTSQADWVPSTTKSLYTKYTPQGVIAEWIQPTGAQDAYAIGVKVTHNGKTWESIVDNNVWEPGIYGWIEIQ